MRYFLLACFFVLPLATMFAQADSTGTARPVQSAAADSGAVKPAFTRDSALVRRHSDSLAVIKQAQKKMNWKQDTAFTKFIKNPYAKGNLPAVYVITQQRPSSDKDELFYMLVGLFLLVAIIRASFPKYFQSIFRLFFQSAYRQKQSRESLLQDNLPSLLLNIAFIFSAGLLIALLSATQPRLQPYPLWLLWLYTCTALAIIYVGKFLFIRFCGWAFNVQQPAFNYSFIVFLVNKIAGLGFLPILLLLAFAGGGLYNAAYAIAISLVVILLLYRYIVALSATVKNLKVNAVHFFIYLCAVEILPLLVIYKLLFLAAGK